MLMVIYKCNRAFINTCNQYVAFFWHKWHPVQTSINCLVLYYYYLCWNYPRRVWW